MKLSVKLLFAMLAVATLTMPIAGAQGTTGTPPGLQVPARTLPPPGTVSPQMQKIIGAPISPNWKAWPQTPDEWRKFVANAAATVEKGLPAMRDALKVKSEPMTIDGVKAFMLTPAEIPPQNRNRLLIHIHGGCFVSGPGESGTSEAIMMAGFGGFKVLSVDYRMPPDHPYPAALDDVMTIWKAAQKMAPARNMAVIGSSAGGGLTLSMVLKAKMDKLPLPAAIAPGTPMSDLTGAGDSFQTNAMVDNVLVAYGASCDVRAAMYANGRDLMLIVGEKEWMRAGYQITLYGTRGWRSVTPVLTDLYWYLLDRFFDQVRTGRPPQRSMRRPECGPMRADTTRAAENAAKTVGSATPRSAAIGRASIAGR